MSLQPGGGNSENATAAEGLEAAPHYRIVESDDGAHKFEITYDVGGFRPEDVRITLENDNTNLVVTAKKEEKRGNSTVAREFKRQLEIPSSVDSQNFQCLWDKKGQLKVIAPLIFNSPNMSFQHPVVSSNHRNSHGASAPTVVKTSTERHTDNSKYNTYSPNHSSPQKSPQKPSYHELFMNQKEIHQPSSPNYKSSPKTSTNLPGQMQDHHTSGGQMNSGQGEKLAQSPGGAFFELEVPVTEAMAQSADSLVEIHECSGLVKLKFTVTENSSNNNNGGGGGGWEETREIVRSVKLPKNLDFVDVHQSRAYIDMERKVLRILIPTSGRSLRENQTLKEIRTKIVS